VTPGPLFHHFSTPAPGPKKAQNLAGVDSGAPDSQPPLILISNEKRYSGLKKTSPPLWRNQSGQTVAAVRFDYYQAKIWSLLCSTTTRRGKFKHDKLMRWRIELAQ